MESQTKFEPLEHMNGNMFNIKTQEENIDVKKMIKPHNLMSRASYQTDV